MGGAPGPPARSVRPMTVTVRELRPDSAADIEGFVRVRHLALPYVFFSPASVLHGLTLSHPDAHARKLVAVADGEVVGTAQVNLAHDSPEPGQGALNVYVDPAHTGRGAGAALVRTAEEHLDGARGEAAVRVGAGHPGRPGLRRAARLPARAQSRTSSAWTWRGPRCRRCRTRRPAWSCAPPPTSRTTRARCSNWTRRRARTNRATSRPRSATTRPGWTSTGGTRYLNPELTSVAVADGRPAAFSVAHTDDGGSYGTVMTGTARAHRGRGLAKLVKNHSLHRARAAGYTEAYTGNDAGNEPMLAINRWFGYEICASEVRYVRDIG